MENLLWLLLLMSLLGPILSLLPVLVYPSQRSDSTETSTTKFKNLNSSSIADLSFCFWVKVNHLVATKVIHYDLNDKKGFGFTLQENYGFLNLKVVDLLFDYNSPHIPGRWRHFCAVYDSTVEAVTIYMDGQATFEKTAVDALTGTEFHEDLFDHISVGRGGVRFSQQFNGEFSEFVVFDRVIDINEVKTVMKCEEREKEGRVLDWRTVQMETGDTVSIKQMETECLSNLGTETDTFVGFGHRVKFEEAETSCLALGGRREPPVDEVMVEKMKDIFRNIKEDCNSKFWVPIRQQNNSWISLSSFSPVSYLPWTPGQPNGGRHQACVEARFDKVNGSFEGFNDLNCAKHVRRCFYCRISTNKRFYLRGMCKESSVDTQYVGSMDMSGSNRPHWRGFHSTEIGYSLTSSSWQMRDLSTEKVVAEYNGSSLWPVGQKEWFVPGGVCTGGGVKRLLLSSCSSSEFTCGDGTCLPLTAKCDGMTDCQDELDESTCHVVEFPPHRQYQDMLPPIGRDEKGDVVPTQVRVGVEVMSVTDIMETSMKWGAKLLLNLTWVENRVRWRDLRNNSNMNVISNMMSGQDKRGQNLGAGQDGLTNIWVPVVIFANTPYNDITPTDEKSSLTVEKVGNYVNSAWDQLEEVAYYEGAENPVTYRRKFNKNFACDFQLYYFPFDTQSCTILLHTPDQMSGLVQLIPSQLSYTGPVEMLQYNVIKWQVEEVEKGMKVVLTLQRRIQHHLFTTFIPTFCLMVVCQSTLYFKADHFKTTAGVAVTTMLVMYTLYQSVSLKLPPTAYIKMIDVWLIFGLILPFCVFFLLVMIDTLPAPVPGVTNLSKLSQARQGLVMAGHFFLPLFIVLFTLSYIAAAATVYNCADRLQSDGLCFSEE